MVSITPGETYEIVSPKTDYWEKKYGTARPRITLEAPDTEIWRGGWGVQNGNPACMLYGMRSGFSGLPWDGTVWYGKVGHMGELVHESELQPIAEAEAL